MTEITKEKLEKRCYQKDYQLAVAAGVFFAVLPIVMIWDIPIARAFDLQSLPGDLRKLVTISEAFSHGFGAATILLLALLLSNHPKDRLIQPITAVILSGIIANFSKLIFLRYRPHYFFDQLKLNSWESILELQPTTYSGLLPVLWNEHWSDSRMQSFPSAHSAIAISLAMGLSQAFPKGRLVFYCLAFLAGLQRVASHAHWPSDVVGGFLLGLVVSTMVGIRFFPAANSAEC